MLVHFGKSTFLVILLAAALAELLIAVNIGFARKRSAAVVASGAGRPSGS